MVRNIATYTLYAKTAAYAFGQGFDSYAICLKGPSMIRIILLMFTFTAFTGCDALISASVQGSLTGAIGSSTAIAEDGACDGQFDGQDCMGPNP